MSNAFGLDAVDNGVAIDTEAVQHSQDATSRPDSFIRDAEKQRAKRAEKIVNSQALFAHECRSRCS